MDSFASLPQLELTDNVRNSVHLLDFPTSRSFPKHIRDGAKTDHIVKEMDIVCEICSIALSMRRRANIRIRMPLPSLTIVGEKVEFIEQYKDLILDEINVKHIILETNIKEYAGHVLEVDYSKCGRRLGKKMQEVIKLVKDGKWANLPTGSIMVGSEILAPNEFSLKVVPLNPENYEVLSSELLVSIDTSIKPVLQREGFARDLVRAIQILRKESDFNLADRIEIAYFTDSEFIQQSMEEYAEYISKQILSVKTEKYESLKVVQKLSPHTSFAEDKDGQVVYFSLMVHSNNS